MNSKFPVLEYSRLFQLSYAATLKLGSQNPDEGPQGNEKRQTQRKVGIRQGVCTLMEWHLLPKQHGTFACLLCTEKGKGLISLSMRSLQAAEVGNTWGGGSSSCQFLCTLVTCTWTKERLCLSQLTWVRPFPTSHESETFVLDKAVPMSTIPIHSFKISSTLYAFTQDFLRPPHQP